MLCLQIISRSVLLSAPCKLLPLSRVRLQQRARLQERRERAVGRLCVAAACPANLQEATAQIRARWTYGCCARARSACAARATTLRRRARPTKKAPAKEIQHCNARHARPRPTKPPGDENLRGDSPLTQKHPRELLHSARASIPLTTCLGSLRQEPRHPNIGRRRGPVTRRGASTHRARRGGHRAPARAPAAFRLRSAQTPK